MMCMCICLHWIEWVRLLGRKLLYSLYIYIYIMVLKLGNLGHAYVHIRLIS